MPERASTARHSNGRSLATPADRRPRDLLEEPRMAANLTTPVPYGAPLHLHPGAFVPTRSASPSSPPSPASRS